ncbi:MAG: competence protein ComEC, partial [Sphingomonadales bacterium]|nr:competence protein ComEC [Sphingomonadales bacterium]
MRALSHLAARGRVPGLLRAAVAIAAFVAPVAVSAQPPSAIPAAGPAAIGRPPAGVYLIHAIDVGTGLSLFVEGHDFALLYDAGSNDDSALGRADRVLAYLHKVRPDLTTIDHLILSHPHEDHDAMMEDVLQAYSVRNVWDSGAVNDTCAYRAFLDAIIAEPGVVYHDALTSGGHRDQPMKARSCRGSKRAAATLHIPQGPRIGTTAVPLGAGAQMTFLWA